MNERRHSADDGRGFTTPGRAAGGEDDGVLALLAGALAALRLAPDDIAARLAAYRFYFYHCRLAEARRQAGQMLRLIARRLDIAADWREAEPGGAAFAETEDHASLHVRTLIAWGYLGARLGRRDEGRAALVKAAEIDRRAVSAPAG